MTSPTLTIIIPVYNRAQVLLQTLDSIAASSRLPDAMILVDNGSEDGSLTLCHQWADSHSTEGFRVSVMESPRRGASVARNVGLAACQTDYVYFFDSDDLFSPSFVADVINVLSTRTDLDVLFVPSCQEVNGKVQIRSYQPQAAPWVHILNSQLNTVSMVFSTSFLRALGGWNERLTVWDDWELGLRVLLAHPQWEWLKAKGYHHIFVHPESQTNASFTQTLEPSLRAIREAEQIIRNTTCSEVERSKCLLALYYRCKIMEGKLIAEGSTEASMHYRDVIQEINIKPLNWKSKFGSLLKGYSAKGGRGAWRLAVRLV